MKKAFITLLIAALALFAACNQDSDSGTASLRINIATTRTIAPEDYDLTVSKYYLKGEGPGEDDVFERTTENSSVLIDELATGSWTIYGEGLNADGDVLVTGSTEFYLSASSKTATLTLSDLVGEGTLTLTFTWDPDDLTDPDDVELELTLTDQLDNTPYTLEPTINTTKGTATYSGTWAAGSYVLTAMLNCNETFVGGTAEAVRIADGQDSAAEITFDIDDVVESGVMSVVNNTGSPVSLTIDGGDYLSSDYTVTANTDLTFSLSADDDSLSDFDIKWYLDGTKVDDGEEATFSATIGNHIISAIASSSLIGSTGSASIAFEAIASGVTGTPLQSITIDTSSGLNLGSDTFIKFLYDGSLMVVSNEEKTIQIATLVRNSVSIEATLTFSEIGIPGSVTAFDVGYVSDTIYVVAIGTEDEFSIQVYYFHPSSNTFTLVDSEDTITLGNEINKEYVEGKASCVEFAFVTPEHDEVLFFLTGSNGTYADLMHYDYSDGSSLFEATDKVGYVIDSIFADGNTPTMGIASENMAMFASSTGIIGGMTNWDSSSSGGTFTSPINFNKSNALNTTKFVPMGLCFVGDYALYAQTDSFDAYLYYYNSNYKYATYNTDGKIKKGLSSSPDLDYAYYIDQDDNELVTLYFQSESSEPTVLSTFDLSTKTPASIAVSGSGANLVLYNGSVPSEIEVVRIQI